MLVLASDGGPDNCYSLLQEQWLRYANSNPNIECYIYKADSSIENKYDLSGNVLRIKREENWDDILDKTFDALEYFKDRFHEFDWICRPNISAFFHFPKYVEYLELIPQEFQVEGLHSFWGGIIYPSGAGFSFRASLGDLLLKNKQPSCYVDDITFGKIFYENNIKIKGRPRFDCIDTSNVDMFIENIPITWKFQYRFKSSNRKEDVVNYTKFVDAVYGKDSPSPLASKQPL